MPSTNPNPNANPANPLESNEHPLFVHSQDHPGLVLISQKLTGCENYISWKRSMKIALSSRNKFVLVTGEFPEPEPDSQLKAKWERANDLVITWICNTVSDEINKGLRYATSAKMLWQELSERFSIIDGHRLFQLEKELNSLVQGENSVDVYFYNMKSIWDECSSTLDSTCPPCNCDFGRIYEAKEQRKQLLQFLMGLNDCYVNVRRQILLMSPLPNISQAFYMVKQEETQRRGNQNVSNSNSFALAANSQYRKYNYMQNSVDQKGNGPSQFNNYSDQTRPNFKKGVFCRYCHKEGHAKKECYKLVGFPKDRRFSGGQNSWDRGDRSYSPMSKVVNSMSQVDESNKEVNSGIVSGGNSGNSGSITVTKEQFDNLQNQMQQQMQQLIAMFQSKSTPEDHVYMSGPEPDEGVGLWRAP